MSDFSTLADILAHHGIKLRNQRAGSTHKVICPKCHGGRQKEQCLSVTIDADGQGAKWQCFRGTCGQMTGGARVRQQGHTTKAPPIEPREVVRPQQHAVAVVQHRPKQLYAFFAKRGIGEETVNAFGLYIADHFVPGLGERTCITFPYVWKGEVVNRKYRPPERQPQAQEKHALPTLFNVDAIEAPDVVVWVEGEPDCLAIHEAGYPQVVTLKDGAGDKLREEDDPARQDDKRFFALDTHNELLAKVGKFILAGDMDQPGMYLREELARRLGRHRCWTVRWPEGCKDACDVLAAHGKAGVQRAIEAAEPYPIEGIQRLTGDTLDRLAKTAAPGVMETGVLSLDRCIRFPTEGRLIVITGYPQSGKSPFLRWLMVKSMRRHDRKWLMFSPEMEPWDEYAASCAEVLTGKPFRTLGLVPGMSDEDRARAEAYLRDKLYMLSIEDEKGGASVEWIIDRARSAVLRFGVTDVGLDPWNEVEHDRKGLNESDYIGVCLRAFRVFGRQHGVNVWIVAHPAKPPPMTGKGARPPPTLYDISGSANWFNKPHLGITVHRPATASTTSIIVEKVKFPRWGGRGNIGKLDYHVETGRYFPEGSLGGQGGANVE